MHVKDYYKTLGVSHNASPEEIKKAFRQMALKFHPDKNNGDQLSALHFTQIQEAYHILSDSQRRSAYNQKSWYVTHDLKKETATPITAFRIYSKCNELKLYITRISHTRIDRKLLYQYIKQLVNDKAILVLTLEKDRSLIKEIIIALLEASEPLFAREKAEIIKRLKIISDKETLPLLEKSLKDTSALLIWERYQFLIVLVITILICFAIYQAGSN